MSVLYLGLTYNVCESRRVCFALVSQSVQWRVAVSGATAEYESHLSYSVFAQLRHTQHRDIPRNRDTPWTNLSPPNGSGVFACALFVLGRLNEHTLHTHCIFTGRRRRSSSSCCQRFFEVFFPVSSQELWMAGDVLYFYMQKIPTWKKKKSISARCHDDNTPATCPSKPPPLPTHHKGGGYHGAVLLFCIFRCRTTGWKEFFKLEFSSLSIKSVRLD